MIPQLNITWPPCALCGQSAQGNYSIHRDGFGVGPEVDLCDGCGQNEEPTCEDIWDHIAQPSDDPDAHKKTAATGADAGGGLAGQAGSGACAEGSAPSATTVAPQGPAQGGERPEKRGDSEGGAR